MGGVLRPRLHSRRNGFDRLPEFLPACGTLLGPRHWHLRPLCCPLRILSRCRCGSGCPSRLRGGAVRRVEATAIAPASFLLPSAPSSSSLLPSLASSLNLVLCLFRKVVSIMLHFSFWFPIVRIASSDLVSSASVLLPGWGDPSHGRVAAMVPFRYSEVGAQAPTYRLPRNNR